MRVSSACRRFAEVGLILVFTMALRVLLTYLVTERNQSLADNILHAASEVSSESSGQGVVAVVGMVHLNGVRRRLLRVATPPSMSIREEPLEPPTISCQSRSSADGGGRLGVRAALTPGLSAVPIAMGKAAMWRWAACLLCAKLAAAGTSRLSRLLCGRRQ